MEQNGGLVNYKRYKCAKLKTVSVADFELLRRAFLSN